MLIRPINGFKSRISSRTITLSGLGIHMLLHFYNTRIQQQTATDNAAISPALSAACLTEKHQARVLFPMSMSLYLLKRLTIAGNMTADQFHGSTMPLDMPPRLYLSTKTSDVDRTDTPASVSKTPQSALWNSSSVLMPDCVKK
jgi:hypothetical protein